MKILTAAIWEVVQRRSVQRKAGKPALKMVLRFWRAVTVAWA